MASQTGRWAGLGGARTRPEGRAGGIQHYS